MKLFTLIVMFMLAVSITAQTNDFLISGDDNSPSTIIQGLPKLFPYNSNRFLTTWKDCREGEVSTYAQWFDSHGNKSGINFRIYDDDDIVFNRNGLFINVNEGYGNFFNNTSLYITACIYKDNKPLSKAFQVYFVLPEGFDIDPLGIDYKCISTDDKFIFFIREDGFIIVKVFDLNGAQLFEKRLWEEIPFRAGTIGCAAGTNNNYLLASFNARNYYSEDSLKTFPIGMYFNIFNSNDSLQVKNVLLKEYNPPEEYHYGTWNSPQIHCMNVSDSLWQIFWLDLQGKVLNYVKIDPKGNVIDSIHSIHFPADAPGDFLKSFSFSPLQDQQFSVFITTETIQPNGLKSWYHSLINFNSDGEYLDKSSQVIGFYSPLSLNINNIFKSSDSTFYCVSADAKDVFLINADKNFMLHNPTMINDDASGSNEDSPLVTVIENDNYLVSWKNETASYGVPVDKSGTQLEDIKQYEGTSFYFLPNGSFFNLWSKTYDTGDVIFKSLGYTFYKKNGEVIRRDSLDGAYGDGLINILKLSDSLSVMCYPRGTQNVLLLLNAEGTFTKEKRINLATYGEIKLYRVNDESFILNRAGKSQYYNKDLEPVSEIFEIYYSLYIGNNRFLQIDNHVWGKIIGNIVDSAGTQMKHFTLRDDYFSGQDFQVYRLPESGFIYLHSAGDKIYSGSFSQDGLLISKPFLVHQNIAGYKKNPAVTFSNDKAFFVWSDARDTTKGYDIYGRVFDAGKIVSVDLDGKSVPLQFNIYQNYPNPFNPATTITYSIPENSKVELRVFDTIGREVAMLVNEEKQAGEHNVTFNASYLVSGVYIYKLRAGAFTQTRKMILLK